jgi:hypothetical protein
MGWFQTRCKWWEIGVLLFATFVLFRPNYFMDYLYEPYRELPAREHRKRRGADSARAFAVMVIEGTNVEGDEDRKTVGVPLGKRGEGRERLGEAGLTLQRAATRCGSSASSSAAARNAPGSSRDGRWRAQGCDRPALAHWMYVPGLALIALVWFVQRRRLRYASV